MVNINSILTMLLRAKRWQVIPVDPLLHQISFYLSEAHLIFFKLFYSSVSFHKDAITTFSLITEPIYLTAYETNLYNEQHDPSCSAQGFALR